MASCPHNDTSFNLFPPLCSASVSLWLRHFGLKGAKEKSRLPKQWTIAVAPGHSGTELLPSFHSNHQENVSLLSPILFERMSLALCERNQAPKKNRFCFFFLQRMESKHHILLSHRFKREAVRIFPSVLLKHAVNIPRTCLHTAPVKCGLKHAERPNIWNFFYRLLSWLRGRKGRRAYEEQAFHKPTLRKRGIYSHLIRQNPSGICWDCCLSGTT